MEGKEGTKRVLGGRWAVGVLIARCVLFVGVMNQRRTLHHGARDMCL